MTYIYAGFLSYAHADEAVAARLHQAVETYKIPKGHERTLSPIFRDTAELTAHHSLSEKIQDAVTGSRVLIVLCSPAAKLSHWVNEEIRLFRGLHGESAILCVLAEGTPDTSFPPALLEGGREPLAANLGRSKESFKLGVTQIAAAMLGVGLDVLIQRETRRKRRRWQAATAAALVFSTVMGATTLSAVTARKAAEANRMQAEGLVEYMITDLKEKLEPVGRLDILDGIGQRAVEYYDAQDIAKIPDDSLARQARSRHILGQVALDAGEFDKARIEIEAAARLTEEVFDRNSDDTNAIFAHAQSEYWVGVVYFYESKFADALPHWERYAELCEILHAIDVTDFDLVMERAWGANNIALLNNRLGFAEEAKKSYLEAESYFYKAKLISPENQRVQRELANVWAGLAQIAGTNKESDLALSYRRRQVQIYDSLLASNINDYQIKFKAAQASASLVRFNTAQIDLLELKKSIEFSLSEFETLLAYEPENETWRNSCIAFSRFLVTNRENTKLQSVVDETMISRLKALEAL